MAAHPFLDLLSKNVSALAERHDVPEHAAFVHFYGARLLPLTDEDELLETVCDRSDDHGLDGWWVDESRNTVILAQGAYYRSSAGTDVTRLGDKLGKMGDLPAKLADARALWQDDARDLTQIADLVSRGMTIELHFVFAGPRHQELLEQAARMSRTLGITVRVASIDDLNRMNDDYIDVQNGHIRIDEGTLAMLHAHPVDPEATVIEWTGLIAASEIKRLVEEHGQRCFTENVRTFKGEREGSVNSEIKQTIAERPQDFYRLNKGVVLIADTAVWDPVGKQMTVTDFSIVDGCQSANVIRNADDDSLTNVKVKIEIKIPSDRDDVSRIVKGSNSQTRIKDIDLASRNEQIIRLQRDLAGLPGAAHYLERRVGEFDHHPTRSRYIGADGLVKVIKLKEVTRALASYQGDWVTGFYRGGRIFSKSLLGKIYTDETSVRDLLWAHYLYRAANRYAAKQRELTQKARKEQKKQKLTAAAQRFHDMENAIVLRRGMIEHPCVTAMQRLIEYVNGEIFDSMPTEAFGSRDLLDQLEPYAAQAFKICREFLRAEAHDYRDVTKVMSQDSSVESLQLRVDTALIDDEVDPTGQLRKLPRLQTVYAVAA